MNVDRKVGLGVLVGKKEQEMGDVKQVLLGRHGEMVITFKSVGSLFVYGIHTKQSMDIKIKNEKLLKISVCSPYVCCVHQVRGEYFLMRILDLKINCTRSILLENAVHTLVCGERGVIVVSVTNKVYYVSHNPEDEKLHSYEDPTSISVSNPVSALCKMNKNYCLLANQYQGKLFDINTGRVALVVSNEEKSMSSFTMSYMFDNGVITTTVYNISIWSIESPGTPQSLAKIIVTEFPASHLLVKEEVIYVGFTGGMISMYDLDGELIKIIQHSYLNPSNSNLTEQLHIRVKEMILHTHDLVVLFSCGDLKKYSLTSGEMEVILKKSHHFTVTSILLLGCELYVITKDESTNDVNVLFITKYFKTIEEHPSRFHKIRKEFKRKQIPTQLESTPFPIRYNERERLEFLHSLGLLYTPPEKKFDKITTLCAKTFKAPICAISLVDEKNLFLKSQCGIEDPDSISEVNKSVAFCTFAILKPEVFEISNALEDPIFKNNPLVTNYPNVRYYAAAPLVFKDFIIGTLCILDIVPRILTKQEKSLLLAFGETVTQVIKTQQKRKQLRYVDILSIGLQRPVDNSQNCINVLREKYSHLQNDPIFEQLQLNVEVSRMAVSDNYDITRSAITDLLKEDRVERINVLHLFHNLKKTFEDIPRVYSAPSLYYSEETIRNKPIDIVPSPRPPTDQVVYTKSKWMISPECPEYLFSFPRIVVRALVDLIGGLLELSTCIEVLFLGESPRLERKVKQKEKTAPSLRVQLIITSTTIELNYQMKKTLFQKPYDKNSSKPSQYQFLVVCYSVQKWLDKLSGSCEITELDTAILLSLEIPPIEPPTQPEEHEKSSQSGTCSLTSSGSLSPNLEKSLSSPDKPRKARYHRSPQISRLISESPRIKGKKKKGRRNSIDLITRESTSNNKK